MVYSLLAALLVCLVPPLPAHKAAGERELFPYDPVLLIGTGERLEGTSTREAAYGNYRYRFATDASQRAFEAMPARFAIAFGGGCGRMGPLSGLGDVKRFEVVDEKLYIFASDACRDGFVKDHKPFLEVVDAPFPSDKRGIALATAARRWLRADAACPREIVVSAERNERIGDKDYKLREEVRLDANLRYTDFASWNDDAFWTVATLGQPDARTPSVDAKRSTVYGEHPLDASQLEAFRRAAMLEPLFLSRVLLQPDVKFAAGGDAEWKVGERSMKGEILKIHWRGVTVDWLVNPQTGQPFGQCAMRRGRDARFARTIEAFSEWNDKGGVRVPMVREDLGGVRRFDKVESSCAPRPLQVVPVFEE
jgi:hypothetical protein